MYIYSVAFTSLAIVVALCALLRYEVIALKSKEFQSSFNFSLQFCLSELKVGAANHFQLHSFALNYTFLHSITLFCTDLGLIYMLLTNQNTEIVSCMLLIKRRIKEAVGETS